MERSKILNPEYSIDRDQPASRVSPLRINDLLCRDLQITSPVSQSVLRHLRYRSHKHSR